MAGDLFLEPLPMRLQRLKTFAVAGGIGDDLSGHGRRVGAEGVEEAEVERIQAKLCRQIIHKLFLRDGGLRHAEAAKSASRNAVGENGARGCPVIWNDIGT